MTIQAILAAMLAVGAPIANEVLNGVSIQTKKEAVATQWILGKDKIAEIRVAYEKGEYADFLKGMDESYKEVHSQDQLSSLVHMREPENTPDLKKWEKQAHSLQEERNGELIKAIQDDNSLFAEKVRSVIASESVDEQKALLDLSQYRYMQPQTGKNSDENTLIDLDLEYEYKSIHLNTPLKTDLSSSQRRELHIALQMEKMDKMKRAEIQDASLKKKIALVSEGFDRRLAHHWDALDLNALAKSQIKPSTTTEAMVASILAEKSAKFNELFKQYLDAQ